MAPWIRALRERYPLDRLRIVYKSVPAAGGQEFGAKHLLILYQGRGGLLPA